MRQHRQRRDGVQAGSSVLHILIAAGIIAVIAALAVPVYAGRARQTALQQNADSLQMELKSYLALDLEPDYLPVDDSILLASHTADYAADAGGATAATGERNACAVFVRALRGPQARHSSYYVNPFSGSREVVCGSAPVGGGDAPAPAVLITDDQRFAYDALKTASPDTGGLRGTLLVVFLERDGKTVGIDVYYFDDAGRRSPTATALSI